MNLKEKITIGGMSCSHCVAAVTKAVTGLAGVKNVSVDLDGGFADVEFDQSAVTLAAIKNAIENQGYDVD